MNVDTSALLLCDMMDDVMTPSLVPIISPSLATTSTMFCQYRRGGGCEYPAQPLAWPASSQGETQFGQ